MPYNKPNLQPGQFAIYAINRILNTTYEPRKVENGYDYNTQVPQQEFINAYIPITFYDGKFSSKFSTYDENLQIKDNSQYSFSFSVAKYIDGEVNPIFYLLTENRRLRLQTYDRKIDFIITSITPNITKNNVVYSISCQDTFSYDLSKQKATISYETNAPMNIRDLAQQILTTAQLEGRWQIDSALESQYYADFPSYQKLTAGATNTTHRMMASLTVSNSTPYNAFIELCKKFNATLIVEYSDIEGYPGTIGFSNKVNANFSGYHLRADINMSAFSVSRKTDNFCSIMHISGGEDADGQIVSITPTMPQDVQQYFMMLNPIKVESEADRLRVFKTISYPFAVADFGNGVYKLYRRYAGGSTYISISESYRPWPLLTSEEIETDFNTFSSAYNAPDLFESAYSLEVTEYFNFLKYRCKTAASFFYDFDYYLNAGLMDQATYDQLERLFSIELRNANIILYCINYQYNMLSMELNRFEDKEEEFIAELCALEEELYSYAVNPDLKPETVLAVSGSGDESALSRTTVEAANGEERMKVLSNLMTSVWIDEYYRLILTLKGREALNTKKAEYEVKISEKQNIFYTNLQAANKILNTAAIPGSISTSGGSLPNNPDEYDVVNATLVIKTQTPDLDDDGNEQTDDEGNVIMKDIYVADGQRHVGFAVKKKEASYTLYYNATGMLNTTGTIQFKFENAVLDVVPAESTMTWPFGEQDSIQHAATMNATVDADGKYTSLEVYIYKRNTILDTECTLYHFKPTLATTVLQRETYLSESNQTDYINYSVAKQKYQTALNYITETPDMTDTALVSAEEQPSRRGLYAMTLFYLNELLTKPEYGYIAAKTRYSTPVNLLELLTTAQTNQKLLWKKIYDNYSDFIIETSFSDGDQLSSEGLFMAAMETFSKYKNPTYEYSTTIIDTKAIADVQARDINVNDMVYVYNEHISSEYTGRIKVTIPRSRIGNFHTLYNSDTGSTRQVYDHTRQIRYAKNSSGNVVESVTAINSVNGLRGLETICNPCLLYCRNDGFIHTFAYEGTTPHTMTLSAITRNEMLTKKALSDGTKLFKNLITVSEVRDKGDVVEVFLKCPLAEALFIITNKASIDTFEFFTTANSDAIPVYTNVLGIEMEERAKPIPLQVTGITQKLREATSQLTVSTDRTMDLVFQRLIQQARL